MRKTLKKRQQGAELVEFALVLSVFFAVFILIVDVAVAMYDRGALINAVRYGARQGSLYWVDASAANYSETDPKSNHRMKEAMIGTAVTFFADNTVIRPQQGAVTRTVEFNGSSVSANAVLVRVANCSGTVSLNYVHSTIGLLLPGSTLSATAGFNTEANFGMGEPCEVAP